MDYYKKSFLPALVVLSIAINLFFRMNSFFLRQFDETVKDYYRDDRGYTYLIDVDSYRWLRRVENFLNTGHFGTTRINKQEYDDLMFAPNGAKVEPIKLHFLTGAYFYKVLHFFDNKLTLSECLGFLSPFLSVILVLSVFVISALLGISYLGSFLNSLAVGLSFVVLQRSCFGWFDTDIYNVVFPVIIMSMLACSVRSRNQKKLFYLLLAGLLTGMHSSLWHIWWLPFYITFAGLSLYELEVLIYDKENIFSNKLKDSFLSLFLFALFSYLSVFLISGLDVLKKSFTEPYFYITLRQNVALDNFWPDVAFSIGELKKIDAAGIAQQLGGYLLLYAGILAMLLLFIFRDKAPQLKEKRFLTLALFAWMSSVFCLVLFGRRFIMFLTIPLGISLGALWDFLSQAGFLNRMKKALRCALLFSVFSLSVLIFAKDANKMEIKPLMNDTLYTAMLKIKTVTPEDAVIATRWDLADFVMALAKRATIDDASWQFTALPYWQNRALLSNNAEEAAGILRMLNSGGNSAFEELSKALGNDKQLAIGLMNEMFLLPQEDSGILLGKYIKDKDEIDKILKFMYRAVKPAYLLIDNYMNNIIGTLGRIASWDFKRLILWQKFLELDKDDFIKYAGLKSGNSQGFAEELYLTFKLMDKEDAAKWISSLNYKIYTARSKKNIQGSPRVILFDNGIAVDLEKFKSYYKGGDTWMVPGRLIIFDKNKKELKEYRNNEGNPSLCAFLAQEGSIYISFLVSSVFADSLFFNLYFTGGVGQNNFELIFQETKDGFSNIYLYRIKWKI